MSRNPPIETGLRENRMALPGVTLSDIMVIYNIGIGILCLLVVGLLILPSYLFAV